MIIEIRGPDAEQAHDAAVINVLFWLRMTVQECARELGCTKQRVCDVLRRHFKSANGDRDLINPF